MPHSIEKQFSTPKTEMLSHVREIDFELFNEKQQRVVSFILEKFQQLGLLVLVGGSFAKIGLGRQDRRDGGNDIDMYAAEADLRTFITAEFGSDTIDALDTHDTTTRNISIDDMDITVTIEKKQEYNGSTRVHFYSDEHDIDIEIFGGTVDSGTFRFGLEQVNMTPTIVRQKNNVEVPVANEDMLRLQYLYITAFELYRVFEGDVAPEKDKLASRFVTAIQLIDTPAQLRDSITLLEQHFFTASEMPMLEKLHQFFSSWIEKKVVIEQTADPLTPPFSLSQKEKDAWHVLDETDITSILKASTSLREIYTVVSTLGKYALSTTDVHVRQSVATLFQKKESETSPPAHVYLSLWRQKLLLEKKGPLTPAGAMAVPQ